VGSSKGAIRGVVSGGQTGVDRAALDVAAELGLARCGWCPRGRVAEDGPIPARYGLVETIDVDPAQRTGWNVYDADATLLLAQQPPSGGTAYAASVAERLGKPSLIVDPFARDALGDARRWLDSLDEPILLNVGGPRASGVQGIYAASRLLLMGLLGGEAGVPPAVTAPARRALVTGGLGLLGSALVRLAPPGWEVHHTVRGEGREHREHDRDRTAQEESTRSGVAPAGVDNDRPVDNIHAVELSDEAALSAIFDSVRPELVIHTAYSTRDLERDVWLATRNVANASASAGAHLIHASSDMVLDGVRAPFSDTVPIDPVNEYGRWKGRAEEWVMKQNSRSSIARMSLITTFDPPDPRTAAILEGLRGERRLDLYSDELRTPIHVDDLARQIWEIAGLPADRRAGVWNLAGPESLSRFAIGVLVAAAFGLDPSPLGAVPSPVGGGPRPRDLRLLTTRADRELLTRARPLSQVAATRFMNRKQAMTPTRDDQ